MFMGVLMSFLVRLPGFLDNAMERLGESNVLGVQAAALEVCLRRILPLLQRLSSASLSIVCLPHDLNFSGFLQYFSSTSARSSLTQLPDALLGYRHVPVNGLLHIAVMTLQWGHTRLHQDKQEMGQPRCY